MLYVIQINVMKKNQIIIAVVVAILVGAASFYGGMVYAGKSAGTASQKYAGQFSRGQGVGSRARAGAGFVTGNIVAKDSNSITLKMNDGSSRIVFISGSTSITKSVNGTQDDLAVGKTVMVNGTTSSDGSVVAQFVQIRPENNNLNNPSTPGSPNNNVSSSTPNQ